MIQTRLVLSSLIIVSSAIAFAQNQNNADAQLSLAQEIELKALVDLVSKRLGVKILYDEVINDKKLSIRAPGTIPPETLLDVLKSALKMKGFILIDAEAKGWKRIVIEQQLSRVARPGEANQVIAEEGGNTAITQTFILKHINADEINQMIKPFLTEPGGNSIPARNQRALVVTDYARNLMRIARLVDLVDSPRQEAVTYFYKVKFADAEALSEQLGKILQLYIPQGTRNRTPLAQVTADIRTNQIIIIGPKSEVDRAHQLVESLDLQLPPTTRVYRFNFADATSMAQIIKRLIGSVEPNGQPRTTVDSSENSLVVTTTADIHQRIEELRRIYDVKSSTSKSPMRFYKLKNSTAEEILKTINSIEGASPPTPRSNDSETESSGAGRFNLRPGFSIAGPNNPPAALGAELPTPPTFRGGPEEKDNSMVQSTTEDQAGSLLGQARVTADIPSNTLIVVGEPEVQSVYDELIRRLDQPRLQVMIEARVVIIDTRDDFSLGIEISGGDRTGGRRLFGFSSFGFSEVDPLTGSLALIPGVGLNGTLIDPDVADAVLRALATHRRARVITAPRILVNDNAQGILSSVEEVPFTSVNASQTVATTSFGGFAEAGTTITVTPHVQGGDRLQLKYKITLNNFVGTPTAGIPPGRQTEDIESIVTVPDGHSIVVGGLNRTNSSRTIEAIPYIENIPLLNLLGSSRTNADSNSSLFVFLKPIILRDDKFKTLKFLSERDLSESCIPGNFPISRPILMK